MLKKFKKVYSNFEIDTTKFYTIGLWCFGIIAFMNTAGFISALIRGGAFNFFTLTSAFASLIFNYALFGFFYWLKSNLPPKNLQKGKLSDMEALANE